MADEAITAVLRGRCTRQYALLAEGKPKSPSGLLLTGLYIARTAFSLKNVAEADINFCFDPCRNRQG
jgi:hypothetical protein